MGKTLVALSAFLLGLILVSCFGIILSSSDGIAWTKYSGNPLNLGLERAIDPWVIYDGYTFKMWFTGITDSHRIYYATSPDGIDWTLYGMVLDKGEIGSWEGLAVARPVILFDGTSYRMWYMGHDGTAHRIGYATSPDGITWTKHESNPILVPGGNGGWDDGGLGEFTVIFNGTHYIMWYNGQAVMHSTLKIGVATSLDGISWTKYLGNPVLTTGSGWDSYHIYTGPVVKDEGSYLMWYSGQQFPSTVKIGLATSSDGFSWSKYEGNPVLDVGPSGTWDSAYVFASSITEKGNQLLMWYWGGSNPAGGTENVGLAMSLVPYVPAKVDLDPDTLNLRSNGQWITVYITLPEGYNVADIDLSTVKLEGVPAITDTQYGFVTDPPSYLIDHDGDGILERMVKFDRTNVRDTLTGIIDYEEGVKFYELTLTVTGELLDGTPFEGTDTITVIKK